MTLTDWKNYLKIEKAKELLVSSDLKIIDIALECGFGNASYFSEMFAKREKITPRNAKPAIITYTIQLFSTLTCIFHLLSIDILFF